MKTESIRLFFERSIVWAATLVALCCCEPLRVGAQEGGAVDPAKTKGAVQENSPVGATNKSPATESQAEVTGQPIPDPKQVGGEADSIVQVANLVYAESKSSECFSDHFLIQAEQDAAISTSRRFRAVKLSSEEIYNFPLLIMTGEGDFSLPDAERENLRRFVQAGGFLVASAGCSSPEWDSSFRKEMAIVFADTPLEKLSLDHTVFHTVYDIETLKAKHGEPRPIEGITIAGRLGVLYSQDGLNDTEHTTGCCCCGGNEILNSVQINVNILAYALTH